MTSRKDTRIKPRRPFKLPPNKVEPDKRETVREREAEAEIEAAAWVCPRCGMEFDDVPDDVDGCRDWDCPAGDAFEEQHA